MTPLEYAKSKIGVREATGKNDGPEIDIFTGGRHEPWCAHFVAWCFRMAGAPLPGDVAPNKKTPNPIAWVEGMERQLKKAKRWTARVVPDEIPDDLIHAISIFDGQTLATPEPGDIIFFADRMGSDAPSSSGQRHVEIVETIDDVLGNVHTIGGNKGNRVGRFRYKMSDKKIIGYGRWP